MRKTTQTLIMAAVMMSFVITGCSENDLVENAPQNKAVTLTTTISLDGSSATTRALDADGKNTFAAGEQIALVYEDANNGVQKIISAKLKAENISSDKKTASFSFAFDKAPKAGGNFTMIYPASMAKEPLPTSGEFGDIAAPNYTGLATQDGTLASLSSNLDLAYCESTFTSDATLPGGISLTNQLAILELSIKDYTGTSDLNGDITNLTVKVGTGASAPTYTVSRTAAAGSIYVAMQPCSESDITITATTSTANYEKTVTSQSLAASTMTPVTVKMHKIVNLANQESNYEAQDGDILTGTLGPEVKIYIAGGAAITLRDANINTGIICRGDATIILEGANKVHSSGSGIPGIQAPYNGSGTEYTLTIKGNGSLEARGSIRAAGIGSGDNGKCGNITISGGTITATGGNYAAGIGSGNSGKCGNITISGGEIKDAVGGSYAAGIGSGWSGACGDITITTDVTQVTATKGSDALNSIGKGYNSSTCGTVTIGCTLDGSGNPVGGTTGEISESSYTYQPVSQ